MYSTPLCKELDSEQAMLAFAGQLAKSIPSGMVIYLHGELGAGKTTFTRGFLHGLGYQGKVKSPTYTLVEPYEIDQRAVYHFDLYRLNEPEEMLAIGVEEYLTPQAIVLMEWAEKGYPLLPAPDLDCYIETIANGRLVRLEAKSERAKIIMGCF